MLLAKRKRDSCEKIEKEENTNKVGTSIVLPIRQTASIFKQSVTIIRNHDPQIHSESVRGTQEKPKQVSYSNT